jgi:tetratricopeptide (TPR) repeat protein
VDPESVGLDLNVHALLTGRVHQRGSTLNIQAELVSVTDGSQIWGEQYNRTFSDIFAVQEEIARQISEKLQLKLTGEEKKKLTKRHTASTEAYQLYLKGRYFWNKRTSEAFTKGIEYFEQALKQDPNYALAYAGIADSYNLLAAYGLLPPDNAYPKAKVAASQALAIDDALAEAHTSLASIKASYDLDWHGAEREFKRAIDLNPNYATGHHLYGIGFLSIMGRHDEAVASLKWAQELDPLSLSINRSLGDALYHARRYDEAIVQYQKTLEMDPSFFPTHFSLGRAYEQKGMHAEALAEYETLISLSRDSLGLAALGVIHAVMGKRDEAMKIIGELVAVSEQEYLSPHLVAQVYAALGDKEQTLDWLERAYREHSAGLVSLKVDPVWDPVSDEPRFASLLKKMGIHH